MTKDRLTKLITEVLGQRCDQHHDDCMTCAAWWMLGEIERLSRPAHEREPPHCSTCECGEPEKAGITVPSHPEPRADPVVTCPACLLGFRLSAHKAIQPKIVSSEPGRKSEMNYVLIGCGVVLVAVLGIAIYGIIDTTRELRRLK